MDKRLAAKTCQACCGFGGFGEVDKHMRRDPSAYWVECTACGGTGQKEPKEKAP